MPVFNTAPTAFAVGGSPVTPPPGGSTGSVTNGSRIVIDGTPMRVVILAMAGAAGVVILRWSGFKFNVAI